MIDENYGYVKIKLDEVIEKYGITKNKLSFLAEMQRTQLNNWIRGDIAYLDLHVLARLCKALDCKIEDLLEYVPDEKPH